MPSESIEERLAREQRERERQTQLATQKQLKDERVMHIARLMASGRWLTRASAMQLSEEWGIAFATIRTYSNEASRFLRHNRQGDIEELRETTIAALESIAVKAEAAKDYRAAIDARDKLAKVGGVLATAPVVNIALLTSDGRPTPEGENMLRAAPRAALDAALHHLRSHPDDFEGARVVGLEAAHQVVVASTMERREATVSVEVESPGIIELPPEEQDDVEVPPDWGDREDGEA